MPEEEILRLLCAGDEQGLDALLRQYGPLLRYVIAPILPDGADREDCLSEVSLRIWTGIGSYDPARGSLRAWLTAIARNAALDRARSNRRRTAEPLEEAAAAAPAPEEQLLRRERLQALQRALNELGAGERALFYRKYYYEQSTAQIAAELGLSERAVEGRLYRLKRRLRRALGGETDA